MNEITNEIIERARSAKTARELLKIADLPTGEIKYGDMIITII